MPNRPRYLDLTQIRLPMPAFVSILHRVSGAALFLSLPWLLCGLQQSLSSADAFAALHEALSGRFAKVVIIGLVWGYMHHLCAGVRHLLLDLGIGIELAQARASSAAVLIVSIALTLLAGAWLW